MESLLDPKGLECLYPHEHLLLASIIPATGLDVIVLLLVELAVVDELVQLWRQIAVGVWVVVCAGAAVM